MLEFLTVAIMVAVGYVYLNEGLSTASVMFCNVIGAGLVAFNFWEPLAEVVAPGFLGDYADALSLVFLFTLTLGLLRFVTNHLAPLQIEFPQAVQSGGGALFGLATGYLVAGFLLCVLQTLPLNDDFLGFQYHYVPGNVMRNVLPPDRVWLAMMRRAGAYAFVNSTDPNPSPEGITPSYDKSLTFDKYATFELRYARYRRTKADGTTLPYQGEFNKELGRP